jgi:hypothetical protein
MSVVMAGFFFVPGGRWERLIPCLVGFITARIAVAWWSKPTRGESRDRLAQEATGAP